LIADQQVEGKADGLVSLVERQLALFSGRQKYLFQLRQNGLSSSHDWVWFDAWAMHPLRDSGVRWMHQTCGTLPIAFGVGLAFICRSDF
jgi:hypothetical protein